MEKEHIDFAKLTKSEWLDLIAQSVKAVPDSKFSWQVEDGIYGLPFTHSEDIKEPPEPIIDNDKGNEWKIGLALSCIDDRMDLKGFDSVKMQASCFSNNKLIELGTINSIHLQFNGPEDISRFDFKQLPCREMDISFATLTESDPYYVLKELNEHCPEAKLVIEVDSIAEKKSVSACLAKYVKILLGWIGQLDQKTEQADLFRRIKPSYTISSTNFLFEIAVIRALKVLWFNFSKALFGEIYDPGIDIEIRPETLSENENHQLIMGTVTALSAVIAGVRVLYLLTGENENQNSTRLTRLMRNIQLILKHESGMAMVVDPAAGSFAIEDLTAKLAGSAWEQITN